MRMSSFFFCGKPQTEFCPHCVEMWCDIVEAKIHATDQSAQGNRSTRQVVRLKQGGCTVRSVRGFLRGNNANNTNLSPLTMNANNSPSNSNTNIGFGNY